MKLQAYKKISSLLILLLITLLWTFDSYATHIRAGDLTMKRTNDVSLQYEVTVILYRDVTGVQAGEGNISFGDGTENASVAPESLGFTEDGETEIIRYRVSHTFPSVGNYKVSYFERNRNPGVRNMEISSETPFYIQSEFMINPVLGLNSSPFLLIPPVIKGAVGQKFVHNAGAFDVDGDSLSYRLTVCLQGEDTPVQNYRFPDDPTEEWSKETENCEVPPVFFIDEYTGDLTWNAPFVPGEYNVAFLVEEWRDGIRIGAVNRDMQVIITDPLNLRPVIQVPPDTCIIAGMELRKAIFAIDQDAPPCYNPDPTIDWGPHAINLEIAQKSDGLNVVPYVNMDFDVIYSGTNGNEADGLFKWTPNCEDIRSSPYKITFEAKDNPQAGNTQLGTLKNWNVKVLGPAPEGLTANPPTTDELQRHDNKVTLSWDKYLCSNAKEIYIYRKIGSFSYTPSCEAGLPNWTGYKYVNKINATETTYIDRDVDQGVTYCYRIYAVFKSPEGGESVASSEACAFIPDSQYMVNTDVDETGLDDGRILLKWTRPMDIKDLSTVTYNLHRGEGEEKQDDTEYTKLNSSPLRVNDTTFTDNLLNTENIHYHYRVELLENGSPSDTTYIANYVRLSAKSGIDYVDLTWRGTVPWNLTPDSVVLANGDKVGVYHYIYRKIEDEEVNYSLYDSVYVNSNGLQYTDRGTSLDPLDDRKLYSYYIQTVGSFQQPIIAEPLINRTQELTVELLDTIPPCPPILTLTNYEEGTSTFDSCASVPFTDGPKDCPKDRFAVELKWTNQLGGDCDEDIVKYNIYFSPREVTSKLNFGSPVATIDHPSDKPLTAQVIYDFLDREYVSGSYAVTALDNSGNESDLSNVIVQDNCVFFEMPNAFSPNGDGINETLIPMRCPRFTKRIIFTVLNRWGNIVYSYDSDENDGNIEINWNGNHNNGNAVEPGTHYYDAKLTTYRLNESDEEQEIKGTFLILRGKDTNGK